MSDSQITYHEVEFLLPAQRFNIQFSYISQKGLPFYREFLLRLMYIAPMSKSQISNFFGLSKRETDAAITDLVERGELTLSNSGRLMLTDKSKDYFYDLSESPQLLSVQDSATTLSFDLVTFSCLGNNQNNDKWKAGIPLSADNTNLSKSESMVEKHFQQQFQSILEKGFLPKSLSQEGKDDPTVYTVNSVSKLQQLPLRLTTHFKLDIDGRSIERNDFEQLNSSEIVHELITEELSHLSRQNNIQSIGMAMLEIEDKHTLKFFESGCFSPKNLEDINRLSEYESLQRTTFIGPIYLTDNWDTLQKNLAPIIKNINECKTNSEPNNFIWIVPSDPFWGKSQRFISSFSNFLNRANTKGNHKNKSKQIYNPTIFFPIANEEDRRTARQWYNQITPYHEKARGLVEGFLGGNTEVLYLEDELVVIIYHLSQPDQFPVSLPIGFISKEKETVKKIGDLIKEYVNSSSAFDKPNNCGLLTDIIK